MSPDISSEFGPVPTFGVSDAVALFNQIFETATPNIIVVGEVANFKISQGKWVFFDIKDEESSIGCFMTVYNLRTSVEDGMKVSIQARPAITKWGKFSLTVQSVQPLGEGSIRRAFELLRSKLEIEGLFQPERKRILPNLPQHIGVISSTGAAGYADFVKILEQRFPGLEITVADVQVQGAGAPEQIIGALRFFNEMAAPPEVIALIRGGGSRDDLAAFDDEPLVRAIAASRVPTIVGVGHEIDITLADLAADLRAATPSNAAQILVPDRREIIDQTEAALKNVLLFYEAKIGNLSNEIEKSEQTMLANLDGALNIFTDRYNNLKQILKHLDPKLALNRGYSLVRNMAGELLKTEPKIGEILTIENAKFVIKTEVKNVKVK